MKFSETRLAGVYLIDVEPQPDSRGFFARTVCVDEFDRRRLTARFVQSSLSYNHRTGTLRGLHYQVEPHEEIKLVRCTAGAVYDVVVDLRERSPTYKQWIGVELSQSNRRAIYIPGGFAHGFVTLADDTEVLYQMSEFFHAESARGIRWDDPAFGVTWPVPVQMISDRDRTFPDFLA